MNDRYNAYSPVPEYSSVVTFSRLCAGVLVWTLFFLLTAQSVTALGGREKAEEGKALTESESVAVEVYVIHREPGSSGSAGVPQPSSQAVWYLFQKVETSGGRVRTSGSREFAGPIDSRDMNRLNDEFMYTRYNMTLEAKNRLSYRAPREVTVSFHTEDMINGSRVTLQPQQQAVLKAAGSIEEKGSVLMRVKSLSLHGNTWEGVVEIAEEVR
ncbi:MAG: hypothetical protein ACLFQW_07295 [Spirochaetaceae bacterium]